MDLQENRCAAECPTFGAMNKARLALWRCHGSARRVSWRGRSNQDSSESLAWLAVPARGAAHPQVHPRGSGSPSVRSRGGGNTQAACGIRTPESRLRRRRVALERSTCKTRFESLFCHSRVPIQCGTAIRGSRALLHIFERGAQSLLREDRNAHRICDRRLRCVSRPLAEGRWDFPQCVAGARIRCPLS